MSENKKYTSTNPIIQKCLDILDSGNASVSYKPYSPDEYTFTVRVNGKRIFETTRYRLYIANKEFGRSEKINDLDFHDIDEVLYSRLYKENINNAKLVADTLNFLDESTDVVTRAPIQLSFRDKVRSFFARGRTR